MDAETRKLTDEKVARFRELNKTVEKGKILFVGSSLMEHFPIEKFMEEMGNPYRIYNRGIGSYRIEDLKNAINEMILDLAPARMFINIGTNDLSDPDMTIEQVMDQYEEVLNIVKAKYPAIEIYMMAYYPINIDVAPDYMKPCLEIRTNEKIAKANAAVKALAGKVKAKYIDVNRNLTDDQGRLKAEYTVEGMHIYEEGYRAILPDVLEYVKEAF